MMATVGPGFAPSMVARNAVGSPPTPRSTRAPCFSRKSLSHSDAFSSLKQSSGLPWIWREIFSRSSARRSTASVTLVLAWSSVSDAIRELLLGGLDPRGLGEQVERRHCHGLGPGDHALPGQRLDPRVRPIARIDGPPPGPAAHHRL